MPLLRKHFPYARFVVAVRDPKQAYPSTIDYVTNVTGEDVLTREFKRKYSRIMKTFSFADYKGMADWKGDSLTTWVDF
jgi:hypothetical protein